VVHVQHTEEREFYALDRLWKDCPVIPFVDRDLAAAALPNGAAANGSAGMSGSGPANRTARPAEAGPPTVDNAG
jgi:hypothetical protein